MDQTERRLDRLPPEIIERIAKSLHSNWPDMFLIDDDEQEEILENYRALRLTCKDLYLKTFRVFALTYFTRISVAFNVKSLPRLRELANHNNSFGLSLTTFPKELICSTYRLPVDDIVHSALMLTTDPIRNAEAQIVAEAIAEACKSGIRQPSADGSTCTRTVIRRYREAAAEQGSIEASGYDAKVLAESLAALPNIHIIDCSDLLSAWGVPDWDALAGIDMESFLHMEYAASGTISLTIVAKKVLAAIAQASGLRRERGQRLSIQQISLGGVVEEHVGAKSDGIKPPLEDAFLQLRPIRMGISGFTFNGPKTTIDVDMEKSRATLDKLLSPVGTRTVEELEFDFVDGGLPSEQDGFINKEVDIFNMIIGAQNFTRLHKITIHSLILRHGVPKLLRLIETNAATLKTLCLTSTQRFDQGAEDASEMWRLVLRAAAACTKLKTFILHIYSKDRSSRGIHINVSGEARIAALLSKLLVSPNRPAENLGWVDE